MEEKKKSINESLCFIQGKLNAPKDLTNKFGGYNYRSCESILQALKPLLQETGTTLTLSDQIQQIGDRFYVVATATLCDEDNFVSAVAYAREDLVKKGMDAAQLTGATSSYARKYALSGLFAIDDSRDVDYTNVHAVDKASIEQQALTEIAATTTMNELKSAYSKYTLLEPSFKDKSSSIYKAVAAKSEALKQLNN